MDSPDDASTPTDFLNRASWNQMFDDEDNDGSQSDGVLQGGKQPPEDETLQALAGSKPLHVQNQGGIMARSIILHGNMRTPWMMKRKRKYSGMSSNANFLEWCALIDAKDKHLARIPFQEMWLFLNRRLCRRNTGRDGTRISWCAEPPSNWREGGQTKRKEREKTLYRIDSVWSLLTIFTSRSWNRYFLRGPMM